MTIMLFSLVSSLASTLIGTPRAIPVACSVGLVCYEPIVATMERISWSLGDTMWSFLWLNDGVIRSRVQDAGRKLGAFIRAECKLRSITAILFMVIKTLYHCQNRMKRQKIRQGT